MTRPRTEPQAPEDGRGGQQRPLQVVHVIDGLGAGGAEYSLAELLPALRHRGVHSTVVCLVERRTSVLDQVMASGCPVITLEAVSRRGRVWELFGILRERRPDLVHTSLFDADLVGRIAARIAGVPVISSLVNTSYDPARRDDPRVSRLKLEAARLIEGWTARHLTSRFHAISAAVREANAAALGIPRDLVTVIPRGRDPRRLPVATPERRAEMRRSLGLAPDAQVLVNVGRQEYQKGQEHLLRAVALLMASHPRLVVLIAGREGNCTDELRAETDRLGISERVRWLGHRTDVPDVLTAGDLFVFPSLFEGLGGAMIEAMAVGLPIVASDLPALREVAGTGNAGFVRPACERALASEIARVLANEGLRAKWGRAGQRRFEERFTLDVSADAMLAMYRETAENVRAATGYS